jgi:GLPGLI family protein
MLLLIGSTNSRYSSAKYDFTEPLPEFVTAPKSKPDVSKIPVSAKQTAALHLNARIVGKDFLYRVPHLEKMVMISTLGYQDYRIETDVPKIDWTLHSETRVIGGMSCQKAVGWFAGRLYTAWFTPSIPFSYGPWKLGGLPGVILEAYDEKQEVFFKFKKFSKAENEFLYFEELRPVKLSEDTYAREKAKFEKDPIAISKAQLGYDTEIVEVSFYQANGTLLKGEDAIKAIRNDTKIKISNPLELQ